jgi:ABC-type phosphate transport system permease subunit
MKKWIQISCGVIATISLLFLLGGSIKISRLNITPSLPNLGIEVSEVIVEQASSSKQDREIVQLIVGTSLITLIMSITGFVISSRKGIEEPR